MEGAENRVTVLPALIGCTDHSHVGTLWNIPAMAPRLVNLDARELDDLGPLFDLFADKIVFGGEVS
jgi:hypothetical protein